MPHSTGKPTLHQQQQGRTGQSPSPWLPALLAAGSALGIALTQAAPAKAVTLADNLNATSIGGVAVGDGLSVSEYWQAMQF